MGLPSGRIPSSCYRLVKSDCDLGLPDGLLAQPEAKRSDSFLNFISRKSIRSDGSRCHRQEYTKSLIYESVGSNVSQTDAAASHTQCNAFPVFESLIRASLTVLRQLFQTLFSTRSAADAPLEFSSRNDSPYLERAESETPEHHAQRVNETQVVLGFCANLQREWRDGLRSRSAFGAVVPVWDGETLRDKTVLVHGWAGLGDSLNFVRFVTYLKTLGARVILEVQPAVISMLARVDGVDAVVTGGSEVRHDYHVPATTLMLTALLPSLEQAAQTGSAKPYLAGEQLAIERWTRRLSHVPRPRVGLSWAGNPTNRNDAIRSMKLKTLEPLLHVDGARFVSLQVGPPAEQARQIARPILDLSSDLRDLEDTAAVICNLDLVVSIDSAVAHLAGGMGKPIWLLRSTGADRRWDLVSDPAHWYPRLNVYSSVQPNMWADTIARVREDLAVLTTT